MASKVRIDKSVVLDTVVLLSSLEAVWLSSGRPLPDYLHEMLCNVRDGYSETLLAEVIVI